MMAIVVMINAAYMMVFFSSFVFVFIIVFVFEVRLLERSFSRKEKPFFGILNERVDVL